MRARVALLGIFLVASEEQGNRGASVTVTLPRQDSVGAVGPMVTSSGALSDPELRDLMKNGFPARLHYRIELWPANGIFRSRVAFAEWDVVVNYEAIKERYSVVRRSRDTLITLLGDYKSLDSAERIVSAPFRPPISAPRGRGSYYYSVVVQVDALNFTDLDELTRWLRGELTPAVRGRRNPVTFLVGGIQRVVASLLGGKTQRIEARTARFRPAGG